MSPKPPLPLKEEGASAVHCILSVTTLSNKPCYVPLPRAKGWLGPLTIHSHPQGSLSSLLWLSLLQQLLVQDLARLAPSPSAAGRVWWVAERVTAGTGGELLMISLLIRSTLPWIKSGIPQWCEQDPVMFSWGSSMLWWRCWDQGGLQDSHPCLHEPAAARSKAELGARPAGCGGGAITH